MDQSRLLGLMALGDSFGAISNLAGGRPQQPSQVMPLLLKQREQEEKDKRAMAGLAALGIGGPSPAAPTSGLGALGVGSPAPSGLGSMPQAPQLPPQIAQAAQAIRLSQGPEAAVRFVTDYQLKAATTQGANPYDRYKVVPGVGLVDLASEGGRPGVAIPTREGQPDPWGGAKVVGGRIVNPDGTVRYEAPAEEPESPDLFARAGKLRDDFRAEPAFKVFSDVQDAAKRIGMFYQNPGAVSDYGLAVAFAKIVDPGSVAREGEVAAVQGSGALSQSMKQSLINAINGEGALPPQMREEIVRLAEGFYKEQAEKYQQTYNEYRGRAERFGINPRDALPDPLQSLSLRPVVPVADLPAMLKGSPPTYLQHPQTGETIYWDGTKIVPQ